MQDFLYPLLLKLFFSLHDFLLPFQIVFRCKIFCFLSLLYNFRCKTFSFLSSLYNFAMQDLFVSFSNNFSMQDLFVYFSNNFSMQDLFVSSPFYIIFRCKTFFFLSPLYNFEIQDLFVSFSNNFLMLIDWHDCCNVYFLFLLKGLFTNLLKFHSRLG